MTMLKDMLVDAADDARVYDVTDRVVRVVRRRRTMARLVPVAAALLVVAVPVAVTRSSGDGGGQMPSTSVADLPQRLTPEKSPPALPEDRGVGPATLAFVSGGDEVVLLTAEGRQYHVNALSVQGISPDGRWLLVLRSPGGPWVLRDLTGAERQEFEGDTTFSASWSPDSRRLVVQTSRRSGVTYMVDLTNGTRSTVPLDPARAGRVCAVRNSGQLVLCSSEEVPFSGLRLADGTSGAVVREITVAALGLRPTDTMAEGRGIPRLDIDDHTVFIPVHDSAGPDDTPATAPAGHDRNVLLAGFDLETGQLTQRYPLPDRIPGAQHSVDSGVEYGPMDTRILLGFHPDGLLLVHLAPSPSDPFESGPVTIELIARDTGALHVVTRASRPISGICYRG
ncbi:TolB family protein [Dactylosporangium sp. NPDC051541]|uniref:TolB family protein n=1 Tax=Dactylosporangium sp. NPDC051541 TaxID=3363977 RepID=UPI00379D04D1